MGSEGVDDGVTLSDDGGTVVLDDGSTGVADALVEGV